MRYFKPQLRMFWFKILKFFGYKGRCPLCIGGIFYGEGYDHLEFSEYIYGEDGGVGTINGPSEGKVGEIQGCPYCDYTYEYDGDRLTCCEN